MSKRKHNGTQTKLTYLTFAFAILGIMSSYGLAFLGKEALENLAITMFGGAVVTIGVRGAKRAYDNKIEIGESHGYNDDSGGIDSDISGSDWSGNYDAQNQDDPE